MVLPTDDVAFLLVVPFLVIIRQGTIVIALVPILCVIMVVQFLLIPLLQLLFQLVVPLSESFNCYSKGLYLPLQCIRRVVSWLVVAIDRVRTIQLFVIETAI